MFFKINALEDFANFIGRHLCWSLFLIKLQVFICEIFKNTSGGCFFVIERFTFLDQYLLLQQSNYYIVLSTYLNQQCSWINKNNRLFEQMCNKGGNIKINLLNDFESKIMESTNLLQGQPKIGCCFLKNVHTVFMWDIICSTKKSWRSSWPENHPFLNIWENQPGTGFRY